MFGLTKREQRWKAEQKAAETIAGVIVAAINAKSHKGEEMNKSEQLIACLEGEIAKRDARIAELEAEVRRWVIRIQQRGLEMDDLSEELVVAHSNIAKLDDLVLSLQCKVIERDAELAAIKAQDPVAWVGTIEDGVPLLVVEPQNWKATPLYAAPVSEAKEQGMVMPERMKEDANSNLEWSDGWNECLKEVARLNAPPVQQVRVPDGYARVPTGLTDEMLRAMKIQLDKSPVFWCRYRAAYRAMLAAAPAAPAADAGHVFYGMDGNHP